MKHTPLFEEHCALRARMIPFGDWEMPERYTTIIEEHHAARRAAGLFDLSHMGELSISGGQAAALMQYALTNDVTRLNPGAALYSPMCNDTGGIVDDVIVYFLTDPTPRYLVVANASNIDKDRAWLASLATGQGFGDDVVIEDRSESTALLAVQGPYAEEALQTCATEPLSDLKPFHARAVILAGGIQTMIARTGYTGEDGFEIYVNGAQASGLWGLLLESGRGRGLVPAGLGARDTLRLEAGLALYGNDIDEATTPLEAGLERWVKLDNSAFCGRAALRQQRLDGIARRLVGLEMLDRAIPRAHQPVLEHRREVGRVTSGTFSPTLGKGIALAYVTTDSCGVDTRLDVRIRDQPHPARVVQTPFYRRRPARAGR